MCALYVCTHWISLLVVMVILSVVANLPRFTCLTTYYIVTRGVNQTQISTVRRGKRNLTASRFAVKRENSFSTNRDLCNIARILDSTRLFHCVEESELLDRTAKLSRNVAKLSSRGCLFIRLTNSTCAVPTRVQHDCRPASGLLAHK